MSRNKKPRKPGARKVRTFTTPGMLPIIFRGKPEEAQVLKIMPHTDLGHLREGRGEDEHYWTVANYLNWASTIASMVQFSFDPAPTINAGLDALIALSERKKVHGSYVFKAEELKAVGEALTLADDMHDATTRRQHRDALVKLYNDFPENVGA